MPHLDDKGPEDQVEIPPRRWWLSESVSIVVVVVLLALMLIEPVKNAIEAKKRADRMEKLKEDVLDAQRQGDEAKAQELAIEGLAKEIAR